MKLNIFSAALTLSLLLSACDRGANGRGTGRAANNPPDRPLETSPQLTGPQNTQPGGSPPPPQPGGTGGGTDSGSGTGSPKTSGAGAPNGIGTGQ